MRNLIACGQCTIPGRTHYMPVDVLRVVWEGEPIREKKYRVDLRTIFFFLLTALLLSALLLMFLGFFLLLPSPSSYGSGTEC